MTIAACYVSPEGVVFGADSTASLNTAGGFHFFNHNQKLFELGDGNSTLAVVTWGLGGFKEVSYRTLFAELAGELKSKPAKSLQEIGTRWSQKAWASYSTLLKPEVDRLKELTAKPAHTAAPVLQPNPSARTRQEEEELQGLSRSLVAGFCIGGYLPKDRVPGAVEVILQPTATTAPPSVPIAVNEQRFWGAPSLTKRLLFGVDDGFVDRLKKSPKWTGTDQELDSLIAPGRLQHPVLPIRDAIDFVHTCIYSTIKGMKFSAMPQICGGPVELAVITTDRPFRWVRHKDWDAAVSENG